MSSSKKKDDANTDANVDANTDANRNALRSEVQALHAEMEIANYGINEHTGRAKRRVSRQTMKERTIKRKTLEKKDNKDFAVHRAENTRKRLRGSKAAFEDEVIKGSLIFGGDGDIEGNDDGSLEEKEKVGNDDDDKDYIVDGSEGSDDEHSDADGDDDDDEEGRYELYDNKLHEIDPSDDDDDDSVEGEGTQNESSSTNKKKRKASSSSSSALLAPLDPVHAEKINAAKKRFPQKKIARTMYRLRNFKSHRMAEKHGDALGRHARGLNRSAVSTLKEVASAAPIAPQVYSSLGLVYESMLSDELKDKKKIREQEKEKGQQQQQQQNVESEHLDSDNEMDIDHKGNNNIYYKEARDVNSCIVLAEKTFGSYHVAALLCKLDYTLWLRAGDAARKVADLHSRCLSLPAILDPMEGNDDIDDNMDDGGNDNVKDKGDDNNDGDANNDENENAAKLRYFSTPEEYMQYHKSEKMRWLEEAKNDYLAADNIHPPGITVPAKLAHAHIQLGNLSEALTILTDLKKNSIKYQKSDNQTERDELKPRSELDRSYAAWLLYADLMLTIGYECSKWNRGEQTNNNYMFRRWLRKYSSTFDWRERRLQSLCLALEAAAGTKCCEKIVSWMQNRAAQDGNDTYDFDQQKQKAKLDSKKDTNKEIEKTDDDLGSKKDDTHVEKEDCKVLSQRLSLDELSNKFDRERADIVSRNSCALHQFDESTIELNIVPGSRAASKRKEERQNMIKGHKEAIVNLAGQYRLRKNALESTNATERRDRQRTFQPLPISASCASVLDITSQLMKLCLGMELFSFGAIVAETVSLYFQERAKRANERMLSLKAFDQRQIAASSNILQLSQEAYDNLNAEDGKTLNDDDSDIYLSDEDDFDPTDSSEITKMMKRGVLPPELQLLHGMCLMGAGGSNFLAGRLIQAIESLDDEYTDQSQFMLDHGMSDDISWEIFRRAMVEPLSKPAAFSFVTDLVRKMGKEKEWTDRLLPIYEQYFNEIETCEEVNVLQINPTTMSLFMSTKKNYYIQTLLATLRMQIFKAQESVDLNGNDGDVLANASGIATSIIDTVYRYRTPLLLELDAKELSNESIETIKILSASFRIVTQYLDKNNPKDEVMLLSILSRLRTAVCWICQATIPNHDDVYSSTSNTSTESWRYFPISSEWQTEELKFLSVRCFNLCVGCSVTAFSGWEKSEFDLKLLRRKHGPSFFGANVKGMQVAGYLDHEKEVQLSSQWKMIERLLPMLATLDFDDAINNVKQADWYTTAMSNLESNFKGVSIPTLGEDEALNIILMYSSLSLKIAYLERDDLKQKCLVKNAMSVVLPLSQYCLDQSLWDSDIGTHATKSEGTSEWEHFAVQNPEESEGPKNLGRQRHSSTKKTTSRSQSKYINTDPKKHKVSSPLSKLVKVPVDILLKEWNGREEFDDSDNDSIVDKRLSRWSQSVSGPATLAMKRVDFTIRKLRQSATINSLQKSSLEVALALLEVMATKECQNPFLCLHQAGVFASQGSKGGNNDEEFKKPLPEETECTPTNALLILGRADCLRAIHFTDEAIFLCSYVAKVCRLHRDKKSDYPWTPKWRVIAIFMYTISIATDATISSFMKGHLRNDALGSWEREVKAEISRARSDAIALQKAFSHVRFNNKRKTATHENVSTNRNIHDEEMDNYSDDGDNSNENVEEDDYQDDSEEDNGSYDDNNTNQDDHDENGDSGDEKYHENNDNEIFDPNPPELGGPIEIPLGDFIDENIPIEAPTQGESSDVDLDNVPVMTAV